MTAPLPKDVAALAGILAASGVVHLIRPQTYAPLMPSWVPAHRAVIYGSGVAELACAAALLIPATRRPGGWSAAVLLVAVYPGNIKMAVDATRSGSTAFKVAAYARLPLQFPLIRTALRAARADG